MLRAGRLAYLSAAAFDGATTVFMMQAGGCERNPISRPFRKNTRPWWSPGPPSRSAPIFSSGRPSARSGQGSLDCSTSAAPRTMPCLEPGTSSCCGTGTTISVARSDGWPGTAIDGGYGTETALADLTPAPSGERAPESVRTRADVHLAEPENALRLTLALPDDHASGSRACQRCGEPFTPVRRHQRFCRPSCRFAYRWRGTSPASLLPASEDDADRVGGRFE